MTKVIFICLCDVRVCFLCVSQERISLVESNQQMTSTTSKQFLKSKDIMDICKVNFCISKLIIQCNADSYCVYLTGGINVYLYVFSIDPCVSCVFFSFCGISNESTSIKQNIRAKPLVNLMPCCIKHTARCCQYYQGSTSLES